MDTSILVSQAQQLTRLLDATPARPLAVMWVHNHDADTWRLWVVPSTVVSDMRDFYQILAETIAANRDSLSGLDIGSIEFVKADHPAVVGMGKFMHMPGVGSTLFQGNLFNGFYLPEGIAIRMNLKEAA